MSFHYRMVLTVAKVSCYAGNRHCLGADIIRMCCSVASDSNISGKMSSDLEKRPKMQKHTGFGKQEIWSIKCSPKMSGDATTTATGRVSSRWAPRYKWQERRWDESQMLVRRRGIVREPKHWNNQKQVQVHMMGKNGNLPCTCHMPGAVLSI